MGRSASRAEVWSLGFRVSDLGFRISGRFRETFGNQV